MNNKHKQISNSLLDLENKDKRGQLLMKKTLEILMVAERSLHQQEFDDYSNGYRTIRIKDHGEKLQLKVPRTRSLRFYPALLNRLRDLDDKQRRSVLSLYRKELTAKQINVIFKSIYDKSYNKQQVSYLIKESVERIQLLLNRSLESLYLVLYIDAIWFHDDVDENKNRHYSIIGVKEDGTNEVLAVVNHSTDSPLSWKEELGKLKQRGLETADLIVVDGLPSIKDSIAKVFPKARVHQP